MMNNRTILGDANQRVKVQVGIVVDGMQNAYVSNKYSHETNFFDSIPNLDV